MGTNKKGSLGLDGGLDLADRRVLLRVIYLATGLTLGCFAPMQWFNGNHLVALLEVLVGLLMLLGARWLPRVHNFTPWVFAYLLPAYSLILYLIVMPGASPSAFVWVYMAPLMTYLLLGRKMGFLVTVPFAVLSILAYLVHYPHFFQGVGLLDVGNAIFCGMLIMLFVHVYETRRAVALSAHKHLLARISHDLRTPVQSILNAARQLSADGVAQQQTQQIEQSARLQLELIDELLEFPGSDPRLELLPAPGYLFGFLRQIEETGQFLAQRNGNRFICRFDEDLPLVVNADFRRLRQLLINLLANAAKFTHKGTIEFRVSLVGQTDDQAQIEFTVTDNGIGIQAADMARLAEPFQRGGNAVRHEGTGLGLYIVRQMLERMGSRLQIAQVDSGGSRFSFILSLQEEMEQELDTLIEESYLIGLDGQDRRILVVDDTRPMRELLYELLTGYGYGVHTCGSVEEAWTWLGENQADLVLCDQYLPPDIGWELLARIRQRWPQLPVILHSAAPPQAPQEYRHLAFDATVLKPTRTDRLLRLIDNMLDRQQG